MFPSNTDYELKVSLETNLSVPTKELPFHLLFLGDWSGREGNLTDSDLVTRKPIEIDRDNFNEVLSKFNIRVNLAFPGDSESILSLHFADLDDFHPDSIFQKCPLFSDLRDIRRQLLNSNTYAQAAREVKSWFNETHIEDASVIKSQHNFPENLEFSSDGLLDQILNYSDKKNDDPQSQIVQIPELNRFIKNIIKPHLVRFDVAEQSELIMVVDRVISDLMRKILHHPRFQSLESAWRGAYFLVRRVETDYKLKIYLLDLNKDELISSLKFNKSLKIALSDKDLVREGDHFGKSIPWAAICGNYTFSLNTEDTATLIRIAEIAYKNNSPFIAHIKPEIFGFATFDTVDSSDIWKISQNSQADKLWTTLRVMPESSHLGLCLSRILVRLPYGKKTELTESFYFEEFVTSIPHEKYMWINPAFVIALLLAQTFQEHSWNMSQNFFQDIDGLPLHSFQEEGEDKTKSCAEIAMTQNNYETVLNQGFIPLISYKNTDKASVNCFQSIAYPPSIIKGKWS